jgi:hypothetical protein
MKIKSDENLNEVLQEQLADLRDDILSQTLKEESKRFLVTPSTEKPTVFITDTVTGKQAEVALFASRVVLETLNTLFKEKI